MGLLHEKGTSDKQTDRETTHTLRLLDQLGPEGRLGEKPAVFKQLQKKNFLLNSITKFLSKISITLDDTNAFHGQT